MIHDGFNSCLDLNIGQSRDSIVILVQGDPVDIVRGDLITAQKHAGAQSVVHFKSARMKDGSGCGDPFARDDLSDIISKRSAFPRAFHRVEGLERRHDIGQIAIFPGEKQRTAFDNHRIEKPLLSRQLLTEHDFEDLPATLAAVGVRLIYVEALPGSKMTGATFLLDEDPSKPVIALSGRGKRLDIVLFILLHELAHLVRGDVKPGELRMDDDETHTAGDEAKANTLAAEWAIPGGLPEPPKPVMQQWIQELAETHGVNPIVVIGQLQQRGALDWRTQLVKGAPTVTEQMAAWV